MGSAPELLDALHVLTHPRHSVLHVAWALAILVTLVRRPSDLTVARVCLAFGVFYTALAVYIVTVGSPLGLEVNAAQNTFHFVAGPSALAFGVLSWIIHGRLSAESRWRVNGNRV